VAKNKKKKRQTLKFALVTTFLLIIVALIGVTIFLRTSERREARDLLRSFHEYFEREELTLIYLADDNCPICEIQKEILYTLSDYYDIDFLELERSVLSESQAREIQDSLLLSEFRTPTTVIVQNKKVVMIRVGLMDGPQLVDFLTRGGILEEESYYPPTKYLTAVEYDGFIELKERVGSSVLAIGSIRCVFSTGATPVLNNIARSFDIEINYLTTEWLGEQGNQFIRDLADMGYTEQLSMPTLFVIRNGQIVGNLSGGNRPISEYTKFLREFGIIE